MEEDLGFSEELDSPPFLSLSTLSQPVLLQKSLPEPTPYHCPAQSNCLSLWQFEAALRKRTGPSQAFHQLSLGQSILYLGAQCQGKSSQSSGGFSAYWDKFNK